MRFVYYLSADHAMPLEDCRMTWHTPARQGAFGFLLEETEPYPTELAFLHALPEVYRLELLKDPETMPVLKAYLEETMAPGTQVQLWQVATNRSRSRRPCLYRGKLSELSGDTFQLLFGSEELCIQIEY